MRSEVASSRTAAALNELSMALPMTMRGENTDERQLAFTETCDLGLAAGQLNEHRFQS